MILIVGYRRRRTFERVLFFLALALFLYYAAILLDFNSRLHYGENVPVWTWNLTKWIVGIALGVLPGLLAHTHSAYGRAQSWNRSSWWQTAIVGGLYLPALGLLGLSFTVDVDLAFPFDHSAGSTGMYGVWLGASLVVCVAYQIFFARRSFSVIQRAFHNFLAIFLAAAGLLAISFISGDPLRRNALWAYPLMTFVWIIPIALLVYAIVRYQALGIGSQKNLVYSVSITFLALLYLGLVRRLSGLFEPVLPPEATSAILLFTLVIFFEPLQRLASRILRRGFQEQVDKLQRLNSELQQEAHRGEVGRLLSFAEEHIRKEFGLEEVRININNSELRGREEGLPVEKRPAWAGQPVRLKLGKPSAEFGELVAVPIGSAISGETSAALDFLAEQLPAVIELCRVIEEKVGLERELDERERLALVGQMAASISHNLKNPLGSMKTVLQVQLENPALPEGARRDLAMVLGELDRLIVKLTQLLRYAKPAVRPGAAPQRVEASAAAEQVVSLLRHEAERRDGRLYLEDQSGGAVIPGSEESLADILSNLVVNAIEVMPKGGSVEVKVSREGSQLLIQVTDDGPGIPPANLARLFKPFFTTKPSGTGLGLAIVERRAFELGGSVTCESPVANGRGARFRVRLPIA
jgi:signal transduction histidine kinase